MSRRWKNWTLCLVVMAVFMLGTASAALAADNLIPGGPSTEGKYNISGVATYDDIVKTLYSIEKTSKGVVDVFTLTEAIGDWWDWTVSEAGRELYVAKLGTGPIAVWVTANIHGNEQVTSQAVLDLLKFLGSSNTADAKLLRSALTIYAMPCMNPDGRVLNTRGTWLYDADGYPIKDASDRHVTVDLNRDWHMGWISGDPNAVNGLRADETKAWYAYFCTTKPDYLWDLHHQGEKVVPDTNFAVSGSLGISLSPDRDTMPLEYKDPVRSLMGYVYDAIVGYGYVHVSRYQLGNFTNVGELDYKGGMTSAVYLGTDWIDWMGLNTDDHRCVASFFEVRGGGIGQRASGYLEKQVYHSTVAWLMGIATGDAWDVDPMHWYEIPAWPVSWYYTDEGNIPADDDAGYVPEGWELALDIM